MYTTKLLAIMDDVMPRRHQIILAVIVVFMTVGSIGTTIADRLAVQPAPAPIVILATATPARAMGLAKHAAPMVWRAAPTAAPPTAAPVEQVQVVVAQPAPRRIGERRSDKAGPTR